MNALQEFKFESELVRMINIEGKPYWVARDVCTILGYKDSVNAVKQHCRGVVKYHTVLDSLNRDQMARIISEPDVWRLISKSELPEAIRFEKWLFEEVLPQIRKTGSYSLPSDPVDQVLLLCEKLTATALQVKEERLKVAALEHHINIELKPKVDGWNEFIGCDGLVELNHVAQICKTGRNTLFKKLRDEKIFYYKGAYNSVYQQYVDAGYFEMRMVPNEELGPIPVIKCTTKGAEWIYNKFYRKAA